MFRLSEGGGLLSNPTGLWPLHKESVSHVKYFYSARVFFIRSVGSIQRIEATVFKLGNNIRLAVSKHLSLKVTSLLNQFVHSNQFV